MRERITAAWGWFAGLSTNKTIGLILLINGGFILVLAILAILAVAINHLMYLWNVVIG